MGVDRKKEKGLLEDHVKIFDYFNKSLGLPLELL